MLNKALCLVVLVCLIVPVSVQAQGAFHVAVEYLDNTQFPYVQAYISVSDLNGLPIEGLDASAFTLVEDGKPVTIQHFEPIENTTQALSIALVMDVSASMNSEDKPTPLERSVEAAKSFVDQLEPQDQVALIKFSDKPEEVVALTADKTRVKQGLDSLEPEANKTTLYDGIIAGVKALQSQSGRRIVVVVTDGKDTGTGLFGFDEAVQEARNAAISVYPMGFGSIINVKELQQLAELTGGAALILPKALDLQDAFSDILDILRKQYLVQYISSFPADDQDHELLVTVNYGGGQEQTTHHFIAKSSSIPISLPGFQPDQVVGGIVKFAPAIDWPAPLKTVEYLVDGLQIGTKDAAPYQLDWNAFESTFAPGAHEFTIKAVDVAGNTGQYVVSLNVQPPIQIEILNPQDGSSVSGSEKITARVTTLPGISVSRVSFLVDATKEIASVTGSPNVTEYEAVWDTRSYSAQSHPVSVVVYDTGGLFTTQKNMLVTVRPGDYSWMIVLVVLVVFILMIPIALRARRRAGRMAGLPGAVPVAPLMPGRPALLELEGMNPSQVWPLGASEVRLGRKRDENDIPLKGLKASRRQALIRFENGLYVIYSLSASNPAIVNNMPVPQMQALKPGDIIHLGETTLRFES
jgi:VWFA-related protein